MHKEAKPHSSLSLSTCLRAVVGFTLLASISLPYILLTALLLPWRGLRIRTGNLYGKVVGPLMCRVAGTRVVVSNKKRINNSKPAIYIMNHTSQIDVLVGMGLCPMGGCGVAKREIRRIPFFGMAYLLSGHLLIDRSNREKSIASLVSIGETVRKHKLSIWIWPEGTRSSNGRLQSFKKGFAHTAIATGLPIVPVVIHDAHLRWPKHTLRLVPGIAHVDILPAIDTSEWRTETLVDHIQDVRQVFIDTLAPHQRPSPVSE